MGGKSKLKPDSQGNNASNIEKWIWVTFSHFQGSVL